MANLSTYFSNIATGAVYATTGLTAVNGDAIFADTSGGAFTVTLPLNPDPSNYVSVFDCGDAANNNITVDRNGETIDGVAQDFVLDENHGQVQFIYTGSDWEVVIMTPGSGLTAQQVDAQIDAKTIGVKSQFVPVNEMYDTSINAAGVLAYAGSSGTQGRFYVRPFDTTTQENVLWTWRVPDNYDTTQGLSFQVAWSPSNTDTGSVRWELRVLGLIDGDAIDQAHEATGHFIDDDGIGTADDMQITVESTRDSIGTLNPGDMVSCRLTRRVDVDTYNNDANLIGLTLFWTETAPIED